MTKKIIGYRDLDADEIGMINEIKSYAEEVGELIQRMHDALGERRSQDMDVDEVIETEESHRWITVAEMQLQQGFMALVRAVALPSTF